MKYNSGQKQPRRKKYKRPFSPPTPPCNAPPPITGFEFNEASGNYDEAIKRFTDNLASI